MEMQRCYGCMQPYEGDVCPHCGWTRDKNNAPHQLPVGTVLMDQYEIGRVLGQGGFGITYLGWDRQLDVEVCVKEYFPSRTVSRDTVVSSYVRCNTESDARVYQISKERFLREGRVLAQLRSIPEIVGIYGSFEANETVYIVMEYIRGMDLARYIQSRGGRLSAEETFRILTPVMSALAKVHSSGLVHRDIAPDNIMLHPRGGAKLLDFGAARLVENADVERGLDRSTEAIVKQGFAPMEQYQSRGTLGPWTDVYAMCATVYYCLTGKLPPEATARMLEEEDVDWNTVPGLTPGQRKALEKGMAIRARDRYMSMDQLLQALFAQPEAEAHSREQKPRKKLPLWAKICAAAVPAVLLAAAGIFLLVPRKAPEPRVAETVPSGQPVETAGVSETPLQTVPAPAEPAQDPREQDYQQVLTLLEAGDYGAAYPLLMDMPDYKDCTQLLEPYRWVDTEIRAPEYCILNNLRGDMTYQEHVYEDGSLYTEEFEYDEKGREILRAHLYSAEDFSYNSITEMTYNDQDQCISKVEYYYYDDGTENTTIYSFRYDNEGRVVEEIRENWWGMEEYVYVYSTGEDGETSVKRTYLNGELYGCYEELNTDRRYYVRDEIYGENGSVYIYESVRDDEGNYTEYYQHRNNGDPQYDEEFTATIIYHMSEDENVRDYSYDYENTQGVKYTTYVYFNEWGEIDRLEEVYSGGEVIVTEYTGVLTYNGELVEGF